MERLEEYAVNGRAEEAYADRFARGNHEPTWPDRALLYVPKNTAISLDRDLKAAGIEKVTPAGKLDFHAFRTMIIPNKVN